MIDEIQTWFSEKYLETIATILGLINIYFGIKEKAMFWVLAVVGSSIYFFVYADAKVYAFMFLQLYYIGLGIYGLFYWLRGGEDKKKIVVSNIPRKQIPIFIAIFAVLYTTISFVLIKFTDSQIPFVDAFITSGSIIALYMMMKKYLESWFVWITLDVVTITAFFYQKLYVTIVLFVFYLIFAVVGYNQWKKSKEIG
jgi:nicotinamide mononucleotide transporter